MIGRWAQGEPIGAFYALTVVAMGARIAAYVVFGKKLYDGEKQTQPLPSWPLSPRLLPVLGRRRNYTLLLALMLACFTNAAFSPASRAARVAAAVSHALFSMACASALEWGHGQYIVCYTSLALALSPLDSALVPIVAARSAVVYLYVCAGAAKLCVPRRAAHYTSPATMRALMTRDGVTPRFNACCGAATKRLARSDAALRCITWLTLALEIVVLPLALFVADVRFGRAVAFVCASFHVGIWVTFSSTAGTMFFQLGGVYLLGLCTALPGALPGALPRRPFAPVALWATGAALALSPLASLVWKGTPFVTSESWPFTNCALFPWSAEQLRWVSTHLVEGTTRIVLLTKRGPLRGEGGSEGGCGAGDAVESDDDNDAMIGRPVMSRGAQTPARTGRVLHNVIGNLWNWTKVYPRFVVLLNAAISSAASASLASDADADPRTELRAFARGLSRWLEEDSPLIETRSGLPLVVVRLVELDPHGLVCAVE